MIDVYVDGAFQLMTEAKCVLTHLVNGLSHLCACMHARKVVAGLDADVLVCVGL